MISSGVVTDRFRDESRTKNHHDPLELFSIAESLRDAGRRHGGFREVCNLSFIKST